MPDPPDAARRAELHQLPLTDHALREALEAAPDGVAVVDEHGTIVYANPTLGHLFGYSARELVGQSVELLVPESRRRDHVPRRSEYTRHPRRRPMGSGLDLRGQRKDRTEFPVEISLSPVPGGDTHLIVAIVRDVTDRREAAEVLMRAQEALALVEDRERIARDLHDTVIQRLFAVGMSLQGALARTEVTDLAVRLERAIEEIDTTIRDIRTTIFALHTDRERGTGHRDVVLQTAREAANALGFEPHVQFDGLVDTAIPTSVAEELVPTLREALSNAARHAGASRVDVVLVVDDDICLRVVDDGIGVDTRTGTGKGLGNMAERARRLGGTCLVSPADDGGTIVAWRVPRRGGP